MIDRTISSLSQDLCWQHNLHPRDAIHLAVALDLKCDLLESFDPDLVQLNTKLPDSHLIIQKPKWTGQLELLKKND